MHARELNGHSLTSVWICRLALISLKRFVRCKKCRCYLVLLGDFFTLILCAVDKPALSVIYLSSVCLALSVIVNCVYLQVVPFVGNNFSCW